MKNILIVEDEAIIALELKIICQKAGYVVDTANNYDKGILLGTKNNYDVIIMDINLGKCKNGIELAKELQKIKRFKLIYITAKKSSNTIQNLLCTKPLGYINKPFKVRQITNLLDSLY